jgi:hypothetical protein
MLIASCALLTKTQIKQIRKTYQSERERTKFDFDWVRARFAAMAFKSLFYHWGSWSYPFHKLRKAKKG